MLENTNLKKNDIKAESSYILNILKKKTVHKAIEINKLFEFCRIHSRKNNEYTGNNFLEELLEVLSSDHIIVREGKIKYKFNDLKSFVFSLSDLERNIFYLKIQNFTYKSVHKILQNSSVVDVSYNKILDIGHKLFDKQSSIKENKYGDIFSHYKWNKDIFLNYFEEEVMVFQYLDSVFEKGMLRLPDFIINSSNTHRNVEVEFKKVNFEFSYDNLFELIISQYTNTSISINNLLEEFNVMIKKISSLNQIEKIDRRKLKRIIKKSDKCLYTKKNRIRYFDINEGKINLNKLSRIMRLQRGLYSIKKIFNENEKSLMVEEINNYYEFFSLIKKINTSLDLNKDIKFLRFPKFLNGYDKVGDFFAGIINRYEGYNLKSCCEELELKYGIGRTYSYNHFTRDFGDYISGNNVIKSKLFKFDYKQKMILLKILNKEYYYLNELEDVIKKSIGIFRQEMVNDISLEQLGYYKKGHIYIRTNIEDVEEFLKERILSMDFFNISSFGFNINRYPLKSVIEDLEKKFDIIRISNNEYITTSKMRKIHLYKKDINEFLEIGKRSIGKEIFFTVPLLINNIEKNPLIEYGFNNYFYDSLLKNARGVKTIDIDEITLYIFSRKNITAQNFLNKSIEKIKSISIYEYQKKIEDYYSIRISEESIEKLFSNSDLFYESNVRRIYISKEEFLKEL